MRISVPPATLFLAGALAVSGCASPGTAVPALPAPAEAARADLAITPELENLRTFARLYGYVRFFHPSDEAADTDWNRFAVYGASRVREARDAAALRRTLEELFLPLAPTLQVFESHAPPEPLALIPDDTTGLQLVAWQHLGVELGGSDVFRSRRTGRPDAAEELPGRQGLVFQLVGMEDLHGMSFRLRASARAEVEDEGSQARLLVRVDGRGSTVFLDDMRDRPITSPEWERYEITGRIPRDATALYIGAFLDGEGRAWLDTFELDVRKGEGPWSSVELQNPRFEEGTVDEPPLRWSWTGSDYTFTVLQDSPRATRVLEISGAPTAPADGRLFHEHAAPGEAFEAVPGRGLSARMPLALFSDEVGTLRPPGAPDPAPLRAALASINLDTLSGDDLDTRLGAVIAAWNVFQHFYPYFDVVDSDWDAALEEALAGPFSATDTADFARTFRRMLHHLQDGHAFLSVSQAPPTGWLPWRVDLVEGEVVVVASGDPALGRGDIVQQIDGAPAVRVVADAMGLVSGSEQWRRAVAVSRLGAGQPGSAARLRVLRDDGSSHELTLPRDRERPVPEILPDEIAKLEPGIFYVDMRRVAMSAFRERLDELRAARGVVIDLRGYPAFNHEILGYLTDRPIQGPRFLTPRTICPDRERRLEPHDDGTLTISPQQPRLTGRTVFLTDGRAISYAESVMSIVAANRLGDIVGGPTAGAKGNNNQFSVPGGYTIGFTANIGLKHDGTPHHVIGILPTIPLEPTIQGIRDGRDEVLERALDLIRTSTPVGR
jgi:C-terminal processing protease CtpA/Prc